MLITEKIIKLCKFTIDLVFPEIEFIFESRPEFFYQKTPADLAISCLSFKHPEVRKLIHLFKYKQNKSATKICSDLLSEKIIEFSQTQNIQNSVLIPIPRSKIQIQKYGFNQCEILCEEILKNKEIKNLNLSYEPKILIHEKNLETQTKLSRRTRIKNSQNSFSVATHIDIISQKIILVDDVCTTGATLSDAERALKEYSKKCLLKFTIAH